MCRSPAKLQNQIIALKVLHGQAAKPFVARDPVLNVDDVVADVEVVQGGEEGGGLAFFAPGGGACPWRTLPLFGDDGEIGLRRQRIRRKARLDGQCKGKLLCGDVPPLVRRPGRRRKILLGEERQESIHLSARPCDDHHGSDQPQLI